MAGLEKDKTGKIQKKQINLKRASPEKVKRITGTKQDESLKDKLFLTGKERNARRREALRASAKAEFEAAMGNNPKAKPKNGANLVKPGKSQTVGASAGLSTPKPKPKPVSAPAPRTKPATVKRVKPTSTLKKSSNLAAWAAKEQASLKAAQQARAAKKAKSTVTKAKTNKPKRKSVGFKAGMGRAG